jgi:hypothetical protein
LPNGAVKSAAGLARDLSGPPKKISCRSGEKYGVRTDREAPAELRAAATPRTQADNPVGQCNHFEITVKGNDVSVVLNGKIVIPGADVATLAPRRRSAQPRHGHKRDGKWASPQALVPFENIFIKELYRQMGIRDLGRARLPPSRHGDMLVRRFACRESCWCI